MSMKYLGEQFDIHCGGIDHIPIHHTNEIAQSEAATGKHWVNVWMHSEFILLGSEKMSKSTGKILVLDDLIAEGFSAESYRFFCLSASYRSQINFSFKAMESAKRNIEKLRNALFGLRNESPELASKISGAAQAILNEFTSAMYTDLNTAAALAVLWKTVSTTEIPANERLALLYEMDNLLGLGMESWQEEQLEIPVDVEKLAQARTAARAAKDWSEADRIRDELLAKGFKVVDSPNGYKIEKA